MILTSVIFCCICPHQSDALHFQFHCHFHFHFNFQIRWWMTLTEGIFCYICVTALLDAALPFTFIKSKSLSLILNQMTLTADICLLHLRTALIRSPSPLLSPLFSLSLNQKHFHWIRITFTKLDEFDCRYFPLDLRTASIRCRPFNLTKSQSLSLSLNQNHFH